MLLSRIGAMMSLKSDRTSLNEKILSESEITRLIWNGEKNPRNRAILRLLYGAGLRVSELVAVRNCKHKSSKLQTRHF
jgi:integrase/recombinase XerD